MLTLILLLAATPDAGTTGDEALELRKAIRQKFRDVRACVTDDVVRGGSSLALTIKLEIAPNGDVTSATANSSRELPSFNQCVTQAASRWKFKRRPHAKAVSVEYANRTCFGGDEE